MNTLEIDHVLKSHTSPSNVFKGVYARNRLPRRLSVPSALIGNADPERQVHFLSFIDKTMNKMLDYVCGFSQVSQCSSNINYRGEYYDATGRPPFLRAYVNFMNKHGTSWT
jgi:hypothetical protein